ncbi:hypothetical protein [Nocardia noduli]|uniref:hypothetical protein n=1 Tax=Nocardia noduli TaxID=2815722 RepID=UPI001C238A5A|nr:hypothetical protein [Nocardia noduli]
MAGESMAERTAWRICRANRWWSAFDKPRRAKNGKVGPPFHDDLAARDVTAKSWNRLWRIDITEHHTATLLIEATAAWGDGRPVYAEPAHLPQDSRHQDRPQGHREGPQHNWATPAAPRPVGTASNPPTKAPTHVEYLEDFAEI